MNWIVLSYSLPSSEHSSQRVTVWRRLKRLGAVSPVSGLYVLPVRPDCLEGFQWLAQEIRGGGGEALMIRVEEFEGLTDGQMVALFCEARRKDYDELAPDIAAAENALMGAEEETIQSSLGKLRKQVNDIKRVDYFNCPEGIRLEQQLDNLERVLTQVALPSGIQAASREDFQGKVWVTRPRPHVDRLSSIWLIRQFIDAEAVVRYDTQPHGDEIGFDMPGAQFTHQGDLTTFEVLLHAFDLMQDAALRAVAEIVHDIDLQETRYNRPERAGTEALLRGWLLENHSDAELEQRGAALFGGLYAAFAYPMQPTEPH